MDVFGLPECSHEYIRWREFADSCREGPLPAAVGSSLGVSADRTLTFDDEQLFTPKRIVRFRTTWTQAGPARFVQVRRREAADGQWSNDPPGTFNRKPGGTPP